jgi:hypothetical protein
MICANTSHANHTIIKMLAMMSVATRNEMNRPKANAIEREKECPSFIPNGEKDRVLTFYLSRTLNDCLEIISIF